MDAQQPMTSTQKVRAALARIDDLDVDELPLSMKALVFALTIQRQHIEAMLPADPADLDELLLTGAAWALKLRSDDAAQAFELARASAALEAES